MGGLTNRGWDDIWVNDISPGDQRGMDRVERRAFFEFGGRDCGQRSIRDAPGKTYSETDIPEAARAIEAKRKARMIDVVCGKGIKEGLDGIREEGPGIYAPPKAPAYMGTGSHLRVGLARCQAYH